MLQLRFKGAPVGSVHGTATDGEGRGGQCGVQDCSSYYFGIIGSIDWTFIDDNNYDSSEDSDRRGGEGSGES